MISRTKELGSQAQRTRRSGRRPQSGYAYLMALFLVLSMVVGSQVILRNLITERISQHEQEAIWRGNQWVRAVRSFYHKTGHYPQKEDDLLTAVPDIHFIRTEALKDPMNKGDDGAWRFIYTNAAGAIIGSVKYGSMQQMALMDMNGGQMPGTQQPGQSGTSATDANAQNSQNSSASNSTSPTSTANQQGITGFGQSPLQNSTTGTSFGLGLGTPTTTQATPGSTLGAGQVLGPLGQPTTAMGAMMQPTGPVDGPVVGGNLIGVGSKVDQKSVRVYKGGKKYIEWEFIWNPLEEQTQALRQGLAPQQGTGATGLGLGGGLPLGPTGALTPNQNGTNGASQAPANTNGTTGGITTNPNGSAPPFTDNPTSGAPQNPPPSVPQ